MYTLVYLNRVQEWNVQFRHKPSISIKVQFGQAALQMTFISPPPHIQWNTQTLILLWIFYKVTDQNVTIIYVLQKIYQCLKSKWKKGRLNNSVQRRVLNLTFSPKILHVIHITTIVKHKMELASGRSSHMISLEGFYVVHYSKQ